MFILSGRQTTDVHNGQPAVATLNSTILLPAFAGRESRYRESAQRPLADRTGDPKARCRPRPEAAAAPQAEDPPRNSEELRRTGWEGAALHRLVRARSVDGGHRHVEQAQVDGELGAVVVRVIHENGAHDGHLRDGHHCLSAPDHGEGFVKERV